MPAQPSLTWMDGGTARCDQQQERGDKTGQGCACHSFLPIVPLLVWQVNELAIGRFMKRPTVHEFQVLFGKSVLFLCYFLIELD